ncbi:MAG: RNA pseudouridine synthase [Chitinophagales bacterium]|nr:RNA pseudouridine synthase [Chitinophagales bacterium]
MALSILYEDNHLIVVNKPSGVLVQGDKTGDVPISDDIKAYIKEKYNKQGEVFLGTIHRLDRPVSGIVVFAKTSKALSRMNELFKANEVKKTYWAVVQNPPQPEIGKIISYSLKDSEKLKAKVFKEAVPDSKMCSLDYKTLQKSEKYYLLEVHLHTGRYHQIRSQLAFIGCPIKGDIKYGYPRTNPNAGIHLHARKLEFVHPIRKVPITVIAPTPQDDILWKTFEENS